MRSGWVPLTRSVPPRGGFHLYYRCPIIAANLKLAYNDEGHIEIETRGQGGQAVMPGSPTGTHPTGKLYELVRGSFENIPLVTAEVRDVMLEMAKPFDEKPVRPELLSYYYPDIPVPAKGSRPGDDLNSRGNWAAILVPKGWTLMSETNRVSYWCRPGKEAGKSASTGHCRNDDGHSLLHVFSSNASPFEADKSYTMFTAYALLYHKGDFRAAAECLWANGYGSSELGRMGEEVHELLRSLYQ